MLHEKEHNHWNGEHHYRCGDELAHYMLILAPTTDALEHNQGHSTALKLQAARPNTQGSHSQQQERGKTHNNQITGNEHHRTS